MLTSCLGQAPEVTPRNCTLDLPSCTWLVVVVVVFLVSCPYCSRRKLFLQLKRAEETPSLTGSLPRSLSPSLSCLHRARARTVRLLNEAPRSAPVHPSTLYTYEPPGLIRNRLEESSHCLLCLSLSLSRTAFSGRATKASLSQAVNAVDSDGRQRCAEAPARGCQVQAAQGPRGCKLKDSGFY